MKNSKIQKNKDLKMIKRKSKLKIWIFGLIDSFLMILFSLESNWDIVLGIFLLLAFICFVMIIVNLLLLLLKK